MKHRALRNAFLLLCLLLLAVLVSTDNATTEVPKNLETARRQAESIDAYFRENGAYPDYFAGMYFDETTGSLIVLVTKQNAAVFQSLTAITKDPRLAIQDGAQFSYNELDGFSKQILDELTRLRTAGTAGVWDALSLIGVDEANNGLRIGLTQNTVEQQAAFSHWMEAVLRANSHPGTAAPIPPLEFAAYPKLGADVEKSKQGGEIW